MRGDHRRSPASRRTRRSSSASCCMGRPPWLRTRPTTALGGSELEPPSPSGGTGHAATARMALARSSGRSLAAASSATTERSEWLVTRSGRWGDPWPDADITEHAERSGAARIIAGVL